MKRNRIGKILSLLLLLLSLTTGLCAAKFIKDDDGNWVEYDRDNQKPWQIYFVDVNAIKAREYEGKKYLDVFIRRKEEENEAYWAFVRVVEVTNAKWHMLIDIENRKSIALEFANKYNNPKRGTTDISFVTTHAEALLPFEEKLLAWVEQNRPDIIKEIRTFNGNNTPSAGTQTVTADGDYGFVQTLGDGPVQFVPRMVHKPPTPYVKNDGITRSYVSGVPASGLHCEHGEFVPPIAPDSGKPLYIIYRESDSTWVHQNNVIEHWILGIFSYDDETDTFTLYESANCTPYKTMHIIDKNQIEIERWSSATGVSQDNPEHFIAKYEKAIIGPEWEDTSFRHCDTDGYGWMLLFDDEPEDEHLEIGGWDWLTASNRVTQETSDGRVLEYSNEVGVDGLFAFLARKGKVGYAPPTSSTAEYIMKAAEDFQASTGHLKYQ